MRILSFYMKFHPLGEFMYEPKFLPQLNETSGFLSGMRFAIDYHSEYLQPDSTNTDPLHLHPYPEIFFNLSSDISFLVNNKLYPVLAGDALIARPNDVHMGIFHKSAVHEYVCIWIDTDIRSSAFSFLHRADFCPLFSFDEPTKKKLTALIFSLLEACNNNGSELEKTACLLQLLTIFEKNKSTNVGQANVPEALQRILDDIHENFASIRSVNDILESHFVSSSTLTRWFRTYIHSSPREYLESVRLSNAATLLQRGASVTDACMQSGFSDCSHFIVLFKKKFGKTPFRYKKSQRQTPSA